MWRDICLANHDAIQLLIEHFITDLESVNRAVQTEDGERLLEIFSNAKDARDRFAEKKA